MGAALPSLSQLLRGPQRELGVAAARGRDELCTPAQLPGPPQPAWQSWCLERGVGAGRRDMISSFIPPNRNGQADS